MSYNLNNLYNDLFSQENDEIDLVNCVGYSCKGKYKKTFMDEITFKNIAKNYIKTMISQERPKTDKNNNIEIHRAYNVLYIDLDYYSNIDDIKELSLYNKKLGQLFIKNAVSVLDNRNIDYYYLTFIASEFPKQIIITDNDKQNIYKGGVHTFIYCDTTLDGLLRKEIYENILMKVIKYNFDFGNIYNNNNLSKEKLLRTVFDFAPIQSANVLFPFAQKDSKKRQYTYYSKLSKYNDEDWFVIGTDNTASVTNDENIVNTDNINNVIKNISISDDEVDFEEEDKNEQTEEHEGNYIIRNDIKLYPENILSQKSLIIYEFMNSLKYLSKEHKFWKDITNNDGNGHNNYYYNIVAPYYKILVLFNLLDVISIDEFNMYKSTRDNPIRKFNRVSTDIMEDILELVARQMAYLCSLTINKQNKSMSGRFSYNEQMVNMKSMFYNKFHSMLHKNKLEKAIDDAVASSENSEKISSKLSSFKNIISVYYTLKPFKFDTNSKAFRKAYKEELDEELIIKINCMYNKFKNHCISEIINGYILFIDMITENITNEIEPFNKFKSFDHQICYLNDSEDKLISSGSDEERLSFYDVDPKFSSDNKQTIIDFTYEETMRKWMSIILTFAYIKSTFQLQPAIRTTISAFVKNYISVIMTTGGTSAKSNKKILIYNIRQTIEMEQFPYNQWIIDTDSNLADRWITKLYTHYIESCLAYTSQDYSIFGFIAVLCDNNFANKNVLGNIKTLSQSDKDLTNILNNIIKTHPTESFNTPEFVPVETSNMFPMRNGWLRFYWKSPMSRAGYENDNIYNVKFYRDNKHQYTESYTNIPWVGDEHSYMEWIERKENKEAKKAYDKIVKMCNEIYPEKEDLDYNMALFASVLYGNDSKDIIHIMFGTGSDGKTTIMNALFSMLNAKGYTSNSYIKEHGRKILLNTNLEGLASIMKAETLLVSNNNPNSHDEGGKACIAHMRLVSVQEPDQKISKGNLNGAVIKELTSGSAINTRKIFGRSESVQANALITFQTNDFPGTDDTTKGFRRRLSVYTHRSKFRTADEKNEDRSSGNMKYMYVADPSLNNNCRENIYFKQAMFYFLLPYARRNIDNGWRDLQKIHKPKFIIEGINKVIAKSTGEHKWLVENIFEEDRYIDENGLPMLPIINVKVLIDIMRKDNQDTDKDNRYWTLTGKINEESAISKIIQNYFEGNIFKLKKEYYTSSKSGKQTIINTKNNPKLKAFVTILTDPRVVNNQELSKYDDLKEFKKTYLDKYAVNAINMTETSDWSDLFLVDYVYKKNVIKRSEMDYDEE